MSKWEWGDHSPEQALAHAKKALAMCQKQRNHWIAMYYETIKCQSASTGEAFEIQIADQELSRLIKGEDNAG